MAFMMSFGIGIRMSGIWPDSWIGVFYTGLGTALFLAGTGFISRYIKVHSLGRRSAAAEMEEGGEDNAGSDGNNF